MVDGQLGVRVEDVERASLSDDLPRSTFALEVAAAWILVTTSPTSDGQAS